MTKQRNTEEHAYVPSHDMHQDEHMEQNENENIEQLNVVQLKSDGTQSTPHNKYNNGGVTESSEHTPHGEHQSQHKKDRVLAHWDNDMTRALIEAVVSLHRKGRRTENGGLKQTEWQYVYEAFNNKFGVTYTIVQMKTKLKKLREQYQLIVQLRNSDGFDWDDDRKQLIASEDRWDTIIQLNKNYKGLRNKTFPHYDLCHEMFDGVPMTISSADQIPVTDIVRANGIEQMLAADITLAQGERAALMSSDFHHDAVRGVGHMLAQETKVSSDTDDSEMEGHRAEDDSHAVHHGAPVDHSVETVLNTITGFLDKQLERINSYKETDLAIAVKILNTMPRAHANLAHLIKKLRNQNDIIFVALCSSGSQEAALEWLENV